ncbi:MAG: hypothetical protein J6N81_08400 [Treponema sp.]|nr:hypothetical protein [Treponema sp.]MBO6219578.1 hypothetical protein [Treponema sp.]
MRPTRSREKLRWHKKLLAVEKRRRALFDQIRNSKEYVEIPPVLAGYKVKLVPIESLKNHDEGLAEAVEASTSWFRFSERPFKLCNLKTYACEFKNDLSPWNFSADDKMEEMYFCNRVYKKGNLKLLDICEERFLKLSGSARHYFVQGLERYDRRGNPVFVYHPEIPKTFVREYVEKIFWNRLYIPNGELESEKKKLSNWLDRKRECELWHYLGYRVSSWRWRRNTTNKKERSKIKEELHLFQKEYEAGVTGGV